MFANRAVARCAVLAGAFFRGGDRLSVLAARCRARRRANGSDWHGADYRTGPSATFSTALTRRGVTDFIDLHIQNHHWPTFNVADSADRHRRRSRADRNSSATGAVLANKRGRINHAPFLGTIPTPWGGIPVYTYGVLVAAGVLLGLWYARYYASYAGLDPDRVWNLGIYMVLRAWPARKLGSCFRTEVITGITSMRFLGLATLQSGGTFYGGFLGALLVVLLYAYFQHDAFSCAGSIVIPRACRSATPSDAWGALPRDAATASPHVLPWGVTFTNPRAAQLVGTPLNIPLHPTQLYEAAAEFMNFFILVALARKQRFRGEIFATYHPPLRFRARINRIHARRPGAHAAAARQIFADADGESGAHFPRRLDVVARFQKVACRSQSRRDSGAAIIPCT